MVCENFSVKKVDMNGETPSHQTLELESCYS